MALQQRITQKGQKRYRARWWNPYTKKMDSGPWGRLVPTDVSFYVKRRRVLSATS
jgi:hypothetical protein